MNSGDEFENDSPQGDPSSAVKKRRLYGACDACRKKKIRCDSAIMPDNKCSSCVASGFKCEHTPRRTKVQEREHQRDHYIRTLEDRLSKLERALRSYNYPQAEISNPLQQSSSPARESLSTLYEPAFNIPSPESLAYSSTSSEADPQDDSDDTEAPHVNYLSSRLHQLSLDPSEQRFFGRSSPYALVTHAVEVRKEITGDQYPLSGLTSRRPMYWTLLPWEQSYASADCAISYIYPEPDLMHKLIDLYFTEFSIFVPLLHRPTFEKLVRNGLHLNDPAFGACLLLVCAVASRFSNDPRVFLEEETNAGTRLSAGWKFFRQVPLMPKYLVSRVSVYDLQFYGLAVMYLLGSGIYHMSWNLLGLGIRLALERGLHRRRKDDHKPTIDEELSKRAFWCFVNMDRMLSTFSGRPLGLHDEDLNIELPVECDDEYWEVDESGHVTFNQPQGKPSKMASFIAYSKLCRILAYSMRTLYSSKKTQAAAHLPNDEWEQRIVAEIDSAMNRWKDSLPDHLEWDPHREDYIAFRQSSVLHALYYQVQIQVHRPFLQKQSPLSMLSFVICTNAARSCSHLLELQMKRNAYFFPQATTSAFITGIVLFLNLISGKRAGVAVAPDKNLADLDRCLQVLKQIESTWHIAGRFWDVLHGLATIRNELDTTSPDPRLSKKRSYQSRSSSVTSASNVAVTPEISLPLDYLPPDVRGSPYGAPPSWVPDGSHLMQTVKAESFQGPRLTKAANVDPHPFIADDENIFPMSAQMEMGNAFIDDGTLPMWYNLPMNFNVHEWESFISSVNEASQNSLPVI